MNFLKTNSKYSCAICNKQDARNTYLFESILKYVRNFPLQHQVFSLGNQLNA